MIDNPNLKFDQKDQFHRDLTSRVQAYFDEKKISPFGGFRLITKSLLIGLWLIASYVLLVFFSHSIWTSLLLATSLGAAMAAVGFNITHDANHGAFSKSKVVNTIMGHLMDLVGGSSFVWRTQHNIIHHTFTNISGVDEDINLYPWGRLAPDQPRLRFHRLQSFYIWPLYGMLGLKWHFDDTAALITGKIAGKKARRPNVKELAGMLAGKALFFCWALIIPILTHHAWWVVILFYFFVEFVLGVIMSITFQLAHCVEEAEFFPAPTSSETGRFQSWARHQIETTIDFAPRSWFLTWYMGGLNYQIEHHLFPRISHIHYPNIAQIVRQVSKEYGVRYTTHHTFLGALASHVRWLHRMGLPESALGT